MPSAPDAGDAFGVVMTCFAENGVVGQEVFVGRDEKMGYLAAALGEYGAVEAGAAARERPG